MGDSILIKIPPLTQERRKELTKLISKMGEDNKIALRNIRQDTLKEIKKQYDEKLMSEDDKKRIE
jgi:ribosome recycling factor